MSINNPYLSSASTLAYLLLLLLLLFCLLCRVLALFTFLTTVKMSDFGYALYPYAMDARLLSSDPEYKEMRWTYFERALEEAVEECVSLYCQGNDRSEIGRVIIDTIVRNLGLFVGHPWYEVRSFAEDILRGFYLTIRGLTVQTMSEADLEVDTADVPALEKFLAVYKDDDVVPDEDDFPW
jgi:hypothetical protein